MKTVHRFALVAIQRPFILLAGLVFVGCHDPARPTQAIAFEASAEIGDAVLDNRHVVLFSAEGIPSDFRGRVERLGGRVSESFDNVGVAVVSGLSDSASASLAGDPDVRAVERDVSFEIAAHEDFVDGGTLEVSSDATAQADASTLPQQASLYPRQWNMRAIGVDRAWTAGYIGSPDVKVVILDTGIDYLHPELQGLVDLSLSRSFVPAEDTVVDRLYPGRNHVTDLFWHGTAMAATVASNARQLAGMTQHVTLIAVKTANRFGIATASAGLAGIVYAADVGADVINVSGGIGFDKSENPGLIASYNRALDYVWRKGALIVSVAGNDTVDLDHRPNRVAIPCESPHVVCTSATGPTAAQSINGPWDNVDASGLYTSYGRSAVSVAAPGGQRFTNTRVWVPCLTTPSSGSPTPCRPAACPPSKVGTCLNQGIGTSFSAAHTSGLAALLVQQLGHGHPALIEARILQSADDLGEPGVDPYYGKGRINIARALGLIP